MDSPIAYMAPELGTLTSTFVYREIEALRRLGFKIITFSTYRPHDKTFSKEAKPLIASTTYLYDLSKGAALARMARMALTRPGAFFSTLRRLTHDMVSAQAAGLGDRLKMAWHFCLGCALGLELRRRGVRHIHAHFAHVPTAITMYGALLAGIPYSFTAHANDIFERGVALREKVARAAFVACISEYNRRFLTELGCDPAKMEIVRCGLDLDAYAWREPARNKRSPLIFSVGRFVEKKGFGVLVDALAKMAREGVPFRCVIVGDGPLLGAVQWQADDAGLRKRLELLGPQPQERVKEWFDEADIFVLPCVIAASGDRDGIPVALMEAMALGVPVVSTAVSGIPELIHHEENGLLATAGDAQSLAQALRRLIDDVELAKVYSRNARKTMETFFESGQNACILSRLFEKAARG